MQFFFFFCFFCADGNISNRLTPAHFPFPPLPFLIASPVTSTSPLYITVYGVSARREMRGEREESRRTEGFIV